MWMVKVRILPPQPILSLGISRLTLLASAIRLKITSMDINRGVVLVTGAAGHIGREVCRLLKAKGHRVLAVDVCRDGFVGSEDLVTLDIAARDEISRLFQAHPVRAVIHLAAILPSAFRRDPLKGADVNVGGAVELLRQASKVGTKRFVFASSMSVYGSSVGTRPLTEDDPAAPDEPYGASKRAAELVGEALAEGNGIEFASLRIARVVGSGTKTTSSPWRSEIFESSPGPTPVQIPFAPEAVLSIVHAREVARMLVILMESSVLSSFTYNTPVELWSAKRLKEVVEQAKGIRVELGPDAAQAG